MAGKYFYKNGGGRIFALFPVHEEYLTNIKWLTKDVALRKEPRNIMEKVNIADSGHLSKVPLRFSLKWVWSDSGFDLLLSVLCLIVRIC